MTGPMKLLTATYLSAISCTAVLITGCANAPTTPPNTVVQEVQVPVPIECSIRWPDKPDINLGAIAKPEGLYLSWQMVLRELEAYRSYARQLEAALLKCSAKPSSPP